MLIFIWLGGDLYKLSYYMANSSPLALQACAMLQIFTDLCILGQFALYRNSSEKDFKYKIIKPVPIPPLIDHSQEEPTEASSNQ